MKSRLNFGECAGEVRLLLAGLITVVFAAAAPVAVAKDAAKHAAFSARAGQTFQVTITKSRTPVVDGKKGNGASSTSVYDGKIVEATESGYVMSWILRDVSVKVEEADEAKRKAVEDTVKGMASAYKGVDMVFETDANGKPTRMRDWKKFVETALKVLEENTGTRPRIAAMTRQILMRNNDRTAAQIFLKEAQVVGALQEIRLAPGGSKTSDVLLPNPLGGPPIVAKNVRRVEPLKDGAKVVKIGWKQALDPGSMKASLTTAFQRMMKGQPAEKRAEMEKAMKTMRIARNDTVDGTVSVSDGWVRDVKIISVITSSDGTRSKGREETTLIKVERK